MSNRKQRLAAAVLMTLGLSVGWGPSPSLALVVKSGNGNTTAPADDQGWSHVGSIGNGSGVYLGNGWVLTAAHVNRNTPFHLNGVDYTLTGQTATIMALPGDPGYVDLLLFKIHNAPNLPGLAIRELAVTPGTQVTMIGTGLIAGSSEKSYHIGPGPLSNLIGFDVSTQRAKLWGQNIVWRTFSQSIDDNRDLIAGNNGDQINDLLFTGQSRTSRTFTTHFNKNTYEGEPSRIHEAQAQGGDSGGGIFAEHNGTWELMGIMVGILGFRENAAIYDSTGALTDLLGSRYGDVTYAVDLTYYRSQIISILPEPSSLWLLTLSLPMFRRRR